MNRNELLQLMRSHRYAVEATVSPTGRPQAAVVGIAVSDSLEIIFDSVRSTRKVQNLGSHDRIAFVIGGWIAGDERTVQYEGVVDRPEGTELEALTEIYFAVFPDGRNRQSWPGLVYLRARPTWVRFSDYNKDPPEIVAFDAEQLKALR
jgi:hypothetical protein